LGGTGILFSAGSTLIVKNCTIRDFQTDGIHVTAPKLVIADTLISNVGSNGIDFVPNIGESRLTFERIEVINANSGIRITAENLSSSGVLLASGSDSLSTGSQIGVEVVGNAQTSPIVALDSLRILANATALAVTSATAYLSRTTISGNDTGYEGTGVFKSYGNNQILDGGNEASLSPVSPN
jgi:hypothetical protein